METKRPYLPEGHFPSAPLTAQTVTQALESGDILTSRPVRCDATHTLQFSLGAIQGRMLPEDTVAPWVSGAGRDITLLSRVGQDTCFHVTAIETDEKGTTIATLSRKTAQEQAMAHLESTLAIGDVLPGIVTHLATFGTFVDIGCGIVALLPIANSGVSRISHPKERFTIGQPLRVIVTGFDKTNHRITVSHKELLGSWLENASYFAPGETVRGVVRSIKDYGCFVELSPNLSGLTDVTPGVVPGDWVSVYIKSIRPESMKIKLQIIQTIPTPPEGMPIHYAITDGHLDSWVYAPPNYVGNVVESRFDP